MTKQEFIEKWVTSDSEEMNKQEGIIARYDLKRDQKSHPVFNF